MQSEADLQAQAEREARQLRVAAAEAALRRVARPDALSSSRNGFGLSGIPAIPADQASPTTRSVNTIMGNTAASLPFGTTERTASTTNSLLPSSGPSNPLSEMFPERRARIEEQQRRTEIAERVRQKRELAEKEARRNAALTPQERAEKEIKEKALQKVKEDKAKAKAERERIKRDIAANAKIRQEKAELLKEQRAREKAADAKKAADLAAHLRVKQEMEREERERGGRQ